MQETSLTTRLQTWWQTISLMTRIIFCICVGIYLLQILTNFPETGLVCFSPLQILKKSSKFYTIFTYPFIHLSILHIVLNMLAELSLGVALEHKLGTTGIMTATFLICILASIIQFLCAIPLYYVPSFLKTIDNLFGNWIIGQIFACGAGYSGVLFGYMVMSGFIYDREAQNLFGVFSVPTKIYPWVLLIISQFIMPGVSFIGHLCGMLAGYIYIFFFYEQNFWNNFNTKLDLLIPTKIKQMPLFVATEHTYLPVSQTPASFEENSIDLPQKSPQEFPEGTFQGKGRVLGTK